MNHKTKDIYYLLFQRGTLSSHRERSNPRAALSVSDLLQQRDSKATQISLPRLHSLGSLVLCLVTLVSPTCVVQTLSRPSTPYASHSCRPVYSLPKFPSPAGPTDLAKILSPWTPSYLVAGATTILSVGNTHPFGSPNREHGFLFAHTRRQKEDLGARGLKLRSSS